MDATLPQLERSSGSERYFAAGGALAMIGGAAAVWYFDPTNSGLFPACPLYSTTGYACPGCGLTRGFHALLHGDVWTALDFNALIPLVILFFGYIFASLVLIAVRGRGVAVNRWSMTLIWVTFATLLIFGVIRNLPFYPFTVLFP